MKSKTIIQSLLAAGLVIGFNLSAWAESYNVDKNSALVERKAMREKWENMSPEERANKREAMHKEWENMTPLGKNESGRARSTASGNARALGKNEPGRARAIQTRFWSTGKSAMILLCAAADCAAYGCTSAQRSCVSESVIRTSTKSPTLSC